nr:FHA domain-containing protein [Acidobacteriota bacterium]
PPEFYSTTAVLGFSSDVYTIGATLFELVTGEIPEPLMTPAHFHGYESGLSQAFRDIIRKSMAQTPSDRYQTAAEMGAELEALGGGSDNLAVGGAPANPYPYLSCLCTQCGEQPKDNRSVFCTQCGGRIHVIFLRIEPAAGNGPSMDLFLDKRENLIGRLDMDENIYPDIDLSRYDPHCYVSREHCMLRRKGTRFFLEPLKTTNRTSINGYAVSPGRAVEITEGACIELANLKLTFRTRPCLGEPVGSADER